MKQTQAQQVKNILQELKDIKIAASKVETDLKFPTGVLWKVKTSFIPKGCPGPLELSEDRLEKLIAYRDKKIKKQNDIIQKSVTKSFKYIESHNSPVVKKGAIVKNSTSLKEKMPKGLSLTQQLEWREKHGG